MTTALLACAAAVALLTGHTIVNARLLRRPRQPGAVTERIAVLIPARNEAPRIAPCIAALREQQGTDLKIVVLDDNSTDDTARVVDQAITGAPGIELVRGRPLPEGWLGKPHACAQLATLAGDATVLVFLDADVVLAPRAVVEAVDLLRTAGADLLSPYPEILADGAQRLVQPLLQWSWLTFLPLRAMETSPRPALAAAGGQFLVVDRRAYDRAGGHAAVRDRVLDDVELARAVKRTGGRVALADGSTLARCRMYTGWSDLTDGYTKSLWAAFGPPPAAAGVVVLLLILYAVPPVAGLAAAAGGGSGAALAGLAAYLSGVAGRVVTARATGGRAWPDAWAHPVSIVLFASLVVRSFRRRRKGRLAWKGRPV